MTLMTRLQRLSSAPYSCRSMLQIYAAGRRRLRSDGHTIFVNSMPKSGSTYLAAALCEVTGFEQAALTFAFRQREQDLYLPLLIDHQSRNTVTRHHTHANGENLAFLHRFRIRPVMLVRDIHDVVLSVRDHLHKEGLDSFPSLYPSEDYLDMDDDDQTAFLIGHVVPWYLQFYVGWYQVWRHQLCDTLWLHYEDVTQDWAAAIARILEFNGITKTAGEIDAAVERARSNSTARARLNRAAADGREPLRAVHRTRIRELTRHYPDVDFSMVGIESRDTRTGVMPVA